MLAERKGTKENEDEKSLIYVKDRLKGWKGVIYFRT